MTKEFEEFKKRAQGVIDQFKYRNDGELIEAPHLNESHYKEMLELLLKVLEKHDEELETKT
jgi:hypothetical protein